MAKGEKKRPPSSPSETDADTHTAALQPAADILGLDATLICSSCGSRLDPGKTDGAKCWLCSAENFVEPAEGEPERSKKEAEKKKFCCPSPNCTRPLELFGSSEKYCVECGAHLEAVSPDVWFRKFVEPEVTQDPSTLLTGHAGFMDAAWRMGLTRGEAEIRLDDYNASNGRAPARRTGEKRPPEVEPVQRELATGASSAGSEEKSSTGRPAARAGDADNPARLSRRPQDDYLRDKDLGIKFGFGIICLLMIIWMVVIMLRNPSTTKKTPVEVVPSPSPVSATPSASASPPPPQSLPTPTPPPMILIDGNAFQMGRNITDGGDSYEHPSHPVTLNSFYIDVYEVTREEYQKCIDAGKCEKPSEWNGGTYPAGTGRFPVTGVTWNDANQYAVWAGKRLPTEEEWEFAARGTEGRLYPWGDDWIKGHANVESGRLAEVGSFKGTVPLKLYDMIGNAQEWTSSEFRKYPDKKAYALTGFKPERLRVIRGGSYKDAAGSVTATYRNALKMDGERSYPETGFRCARDAARQ